MGAGVGGGVGPPSEYLLSCYLSPPGDHAVLGTRHDQSIALWRRGPRGVDLVRLWELERISGQKHHFWPLYTPERAREFLDALLGTVGLTLDDVGTVWGTPGLPGSAPVPVPAGAGAFPVHSLAHLFSGLLMDTRLFKDETIVATAVDSGPDFVQDRATKDFWYAGCVSVRGSLTFLPVESPGPLYTAAETMFGKEPGTLMALASACRTAIPYPTAEALAGIKLFGGRAAPWAPAHRFVRGVVAEAGRRLANRADDPAFSPEENLQSAVMKIVQEACELVAARNIDLLCATAHVDPSTAYLSMSGGYALNCPGNTRLLDKYGFRGLLAPPCANDSGQALGLGLLGLYGTGAFRDAEWRLGNAYHGSPVSDLPSSLEEFAPWIADVTEFDPVRFAADVTDDIVAWVDGAAEIGPRALGHRSLLGDPRSGAVKDRLNDVKQRQWWRPVAPIVMAEHAEDWFVQRRPSPYMLEAVDVRPEVRERVPAVVHLDGSARHQTLARDDNPLLHRALAAFRDATGVPMLCNTSLNDKGEAICDTAAEALTFCVRRGIRVAYVSGRRIALRTTPTGNAVPPTGPRVRAVHHFAGQEPDRDAAWSRWLDRGLTEAGMFQLSRSPDLRTELDAGGTPERVNALADYAATTNRGFPLMVNRFCKAHGPGSAFIDAPGALPARLASKEA
ncbi:carbamoyltransferase C-terminal domain-containing protein [Yinghuangia seranimata]|uniref:carbamoyltransferase C-terminal domain-containing protein n=1 Tax=Yinghuangia seranimata TaxID=408067 RepID=UPI00248B10AF|nr:carbamoyltransferase C-terminal domain-containing protein [Yinghuangia seranimata]MDI2130077.1 carbamoyltransferase C-terminal domain-containing protein [Yinghuangia seranimata]